MVFIINLLHILLQLASFALFIYIVILLLVHFDFLNGRNPTIVKILQTFELIFEPALKRIRAKIPPRNGLDISPFVLSIILLVIDWILVLIF